MSPRGPGPWGEELATPSLGCGPAARGRRRAVLPNPEGAEDWGPRLHPERLVETTKAWWRRASRRDDTAPRARTPT